MDASAVGAEASPAKPAAADTHPPQAKATATASESLIAPDLSLLLPGWPATLSLREPSAVDLETTPGQDRTVRGSALTDGLRRERGELSQAGAGLRPTASPQTDSTRPAPPLPSVAAMAAELAPASALRTAAEGPAALPAPTLHANFMPATAASVASAAASAPPPFEAQLAAALDSPAFAPALATQVSWLVREGVQHARLRLNPAEMGPVTIQIAVDGTQTRVDFSADLVATRAAIESSLPTLAAALNESGLKLAGGGVFDGQPRPGTQGERGQSAPRLAQPGIPADAGSQVQGLSRAAAVVPRGLVDLVA